MTRERTRRFRRRGAALALGVGVLVAVEVGLRVVAVDEAPAVLPSDWGQGVRLAAVGQPVRLEVDAVVRTSREAVRDRVMYDLEFAATADDLRVFIFGGSAALGVPLDATPERTWAGRLEVELEERISRSVEVLNLAGASFGSDHVVALMTDAVALDPDLLLVYTGNNEFFNYNLELVRINQDLGLGRAWADRSHLFRAVRRALGEPVTVAEALERLGPDGTEQVQRAAVATAMQDLWVEPERRPAQVDGRWRRRDPVHAAVIERFAANLQAMVDLAGEVPLVLVSPPVNLRAEPGLYVDTVTKDGSHVSAMSLWREGMGPPMDNDLLRDALELDLDPGRPVEGILGAIRGAGVPVVGPLEGDPFHDRCHLTEEGQRELATLLARRLAPILTDR